MEISDKDNGRTRLRHTRRRVFRELMEIASFSRSEEIDKRLDELLDEFFESGCEVRDRDKYLGK